MSSLQEHIARHERAQANLAAALYAKGLQANGSGNSPGAAAYWDAQHMVECSDTEEQQ